MISHSIKYPAGPPSSPHHRRERRVRCGIHNQNLSYSHNTLPGHSVDREIAAVRRGDPVGGRGHGERRRVRSDWVAVERERGISVSSAVMSFEHGGLAFNLLDTPGHQDFSEDTYAP